MIDWSSTPFEIMGEAQNGKDALEKIRLDPPDIVVTDVLMPVMNGIELADEIRNRYPRIRTLILSGFNDFEYVRDAMRGGAVDYLLKAQLDRTMLLDSLTRISGNITRAPIKPLPHSPDHRPVRYCLTFSEILTHMRENMGDPITLTDVAVKFHYNKSYLCQLFRKNLGISFSRYLMSIRMEKASELLLEQGYSVSHVRELVGYPSYDHFSRHFKLTFGCTPYQYIKAASMQSAEGGRI